MKFKILTLILFASMLLVACSSGNDTSSNDSESVDMKQLVNDYSTRSIENETAAITATQLIVTDENNKETLYDLPEDEFFVSIAPYINETHP